MAKNEKMVKAITSMDEDFAKGTPMFVSRRSLLITLR